MRLTCFCAGLYRLPLVPLILPAASISPSAWRSVRPHYILGIQAAVPFVNKPLRFYASSWEPQIARNSEYLCVVCVSRFWEAKAQNGTALLSIALVCNVTCFLCLSLSISVSLRCQYGTQRNDSGAASCREQHQSARARFETQLVYIRRDVVYTTVMCICLVVIYLPTLVALCTKLRLMGRFVNRELERSVRKRQRSILRHCVDICLQGIQETGGAQAEI